MKTRVQGILVFTALALLGFGQAQAGDYLVDLEALSNAFDGSLNRIIISDPYYPENYAHVRYLSQKDLFEIISVVSRNDEEGFDEPSKNRDDDVDPAMSQGSSVYVIANGDGEATIEDDGDDERLNKIPLTLVRGHNTVYLLHKSSRMSPPGPLEGMVNQEIPAQWLSIPGDLPLLLSREQLDTLLSDFNTEEAPPAEEDAESSKEDDYESPHIDAQEESPVIEAASDDFGEEEDDGLFDLGDDFLGLEKENYNDDLDEDGNTFEDDCIFSQEDGFVTFHEELQQESTGADLDRTLLSDNSDEWALGDEVPSEVFDIESSVDGDNEEASAHAPVDNAEEPATRSGLELITMRIFEYDRPILKPSELVEAPGVFDIESNIDDDMEDTSVPVSMDDNEAAPTHVAIDDDQGAEGDTKASAEEAPARGALLDFFFRLFGV